MFDFTNKVVVVIGGTSGINRGIAEAFAKAGARVAVASRDQNKVDATVIALQELGAEACGFSADVRDSEAIQSGLQTIAAQWGDFDVLVSGAAGNFPALAADMSSNAFKSVVDIDLNGSFNVLHSAYAFLKKPGASVINISAPQAFVAVLGQSHVCAAKAGVDMLTRSLALEWGGEKVRVNSIVPGPIEGTEGMKRLVANEKMKELTRQSVPLKRLGQTQDVANACMFLSSEWASYINGVILPVDGGWSLAGASGLNALMEAALRP